MEVIFLILCFVTAALELWYLFAYLLPNFFPPKKKYLITYKCYYKFTTVIYARNPAQALRIFRRIYSCYDVLDIKKVKE